MMNDWCKWSDWYEWLYRMSNMNNMNNLISIEVRFDWLFAEYSHDNMTEIRLMMYKVTVRVVMREVEKQWAI